MEQILGNSDIANWTGNKSTSTGLIDIMNAKLINSTIGTNPNESFKKGDALPPVSYTHLTLPTKQAV